MIIFIDFENGKLRLEATKVPNSQDKPASIITQGTDAEEAMAYLLKLRCLHFNKDNMMIISFYKKDYLQHKQHWQPATSGGTLAEAQLDQDQALS